MTTKYKYGYYGATYLLIIFIIVGEAVYRYLSRELKDQFDEDGKLIKKATTTMQV